jgi:uncharacterized phage protein (TIGR02218 family)
MKNAPAGLIAHLAAGGPFLMADLVTLTLQGGQVYRWSLADTNITLNSNLFTASTEAGTQPLVSRGSIRQARGLEVSTMDLTLSTGDTAQLLGIDASLAAHNGALDWAQVRVERIFMPTWGDTSLGAVILFEGGVAGVTPGATTIAVHVNSDLQKLQVQMPPHLFMPSCANTFCDAACGLNLATLTVSKTVAAGSTPSSLQGASGQADGYYANGVVSFTSGANAGSRRAVTSYVAGVLTLAIPLQAAPATGDAFTVSPNCGRTKAGCALFANSTRFSGCPYIPPPEASR